jgi:hypothetical protein
MSTNRIDKEVVMTAVRRKMSEETKARIAAGRKGKKHSEETKARLAAHTRAAYAALRALTAEAKREEGE